MRASEFINEAVAGTIVRGDYSIDIDDHSFDQLLKRNIYPRDVDKVLNRIGEVRHNISQIYPHSQFYVVDKDLDLSLGMRKLAANKLMLKTVVFTSTPYGRNTPVFFLNSHSQPGDDHESK